LPSRKKIIATLNAVYTRAATIQDLYCKHDNQNCQHHPLRWIELQRNGDLRGLKPVYHNSEPIDISDSSDDVLFSLMISRHANPEDEFEEWC